MSLLVKYAAGRHVAITHMPYTCSLSVLPETQNVTGIKNLLGQWLSLVGYRNFIRIFEFILYAGIGVWSTQ